MRFVVSAPLWYLDVSKEDYNCGGCGVRILKRGKVLGDLEEEAYCGWVSVEWEIEGAECRYACVHVVVYLVCSYRVGGGSKRGR